MPGTAAVLRGRVLSAWYSCSVEGRGVEYLVQLPCVVELPPLVKKEGGDVIKDLESVQQYRKTSADLECHVRDTALKLRLTDTAIRMFM